MSPCPRRPTRAQVALLSGLLFFVASQALLSVAMDAWLPELRDPEYGYKLALLRRRLAEAPGRPLVLALGSSRTCMGFRPELLPDYRLPDGRTPLLFNFGITASGPLRELLYFRRLLNAGIVPRHVFIEIMPALLATDTPGEHLIPVDRLAWGELALVGRYCSPGVTLSRSWWPQRLRLWHAYRYCLMNRWLPGLLPWDSRRDFLWASLGRSGTLLWGRDAATPEEYTRGVEQARRGYAPPLGQFHIADVPDRALREMLDLCRQFGIDTTLLLMPEGTALRGWYSPDAPSVLQDYLDRLGRDYHVAVIDARTWVADAGFSDGHHLLPGGAAAFTERFAREVLQPMLEGREAIRFTPQGGAAAFRSQR